MTERHTSTGALGRPRDPAKIAAILAASWRLFLARGVDAVTVDAIAAEAGVSKGTVYAYFPDKRALFAEGVRREMAAIEAAQGLRETPPDAPLADVLIAFGIGISTFLASASAVDFYATLAGELRRDGELARMFYDAGPGRTRRNLAAILRSPLAAGLAIDDVEAAADILFGMWQGFANYQLSLGIDVAPLVAAIPHRVARGVRLFLRAYAA